MEQKYWKSLGILSVRKSENHVVYLLRLLLVDAVLGNLLQLDLPSFLDDLSHTIDLVFGKQLPSDKDTIGKNTKRDVKDLKYLRTSMNFVVDLFCFFVFNLATTKTCNFPSKRH